jgi:hypothetical protein
LAALRQEHFLVLCRMGGVAGQASFSAIDRGVGVGGLFSLVGMAGETELIAGIGEASRSPIVGVMAEDTCRPGRRVFDPAASLQSGLIVTLITGSPPLRTVSNGLSDVAGLWHESQDTEATGLWVLVLRSFACAEE